MNISGSTTSELAVYQEKVKKVQMLPAELQGGFGFSHGEVYFEPQANYDEAAMEEEAKRTQQEFLVKPIELTDVLDRMIVEYAGERGQIRIEVHNDADIAGVIREGSNHDDAEKIKLGDQEAVYRVFTFAENGVQSESKQVSWIKNQTKLSYTISTKNKDVTKEQLMQIAKKLVEAK